MVNRKADDTGSGDGDGSMSTTIIPVPADVAWVCALALGLGYSAQQEDACVQELLTAARGNATTLQQAAESLDELAVTDLAARQRTCRLLELAWRTALDHPVNTRLRRDCDPAASDRTPTPSQASSSGRCDRR